MRKRKIEHQGVVDRITSNELVVSIIQDTACATCAAAQLCKSSEKQEKMMVISCSETSKYRVGQKVIIVGDLGIGLRATLWAYVVPLVILVSILVGVAQYTGNEGYAAIAAISSMIPYYILLYALRDKMQHCFQFRIKG